MSEAENSTGPGEGEPSGSEPNAVNDGDAKAEMSANDEERYSSANEGAAGAQSTQRPPSSNSSTGGGDTGLVAAASGAKSQSTTKVIYHVDEQKTPYLLKVPGSAGDISLKDFKAALNRPGSSFKYFFNSVDDDFG